MTDEKQRQMLTACLSTFLVFITTVFVVAQAGLPPRDGLLLIALCAAVLGMGYLTIRLGRRVSESLLTK